MSSKCFFFFLMLKRRYFQVRAILINIFGGIVNCATVAKGLINAFKLAKLNVPLVVRLEGNFENFKKKKIYFLLLVFLILVIKYCEKKICF